MSTLNLKEQLTEVWEIGQLVTEIRWLVDRITETEQNITKSIELKEYREKVIADSKLEIEAKKQRIKDFANAL